MSDYSSSTSILCDDTARSSFLTGQLTIQHGLGQEAPRQKCIPRGLYALWNQCDMSCGELWFMVQLHSTSADFTPDYKRIEQLWSDRACCPLLAGDKFTAVDALCTSGVQNSNVWLVAHHQKFSRLC